MPQEPPAVIEEGAFNPPVGYLQPGPDGLPLLQQAQHPHPLFNHAQHAQHSQHTEEEEHFVPLDVLGRTDQPPPAHGADFDAHAASAWGPGDANEQQVRLE